MNRNRLLSILLISCLLMGLAVSCSKTGKDDTADEIIEENVEVEDPGYVSINDLVETEDEENDGTETTLEAALPVLEEAGYTKTDDGYLGKDDVDGVKSERLINAEGNHATAVLSYDYGSDNDEMRKFYKEEKDAVNGMVSSILILLAERANASEGDMEYTISIGGKKAAEGKITVDEAAEYLENIITD